jgi:hypothetical protein
MTRGDSLAGTVTAAMGTIILAMWAAFARGGVFSGGLRTIENNQYLAFHVIAESVMGVLLAVGGAGLLLQRSWGRGVALLGWGAVVYSTINALGHTVKNDQKLTPVLLAALASALPMAWLLNRREGS